MNFLLVSLVLLPGVFGHSWMSCPPSFVTTNGRGGTQDKPCETNGNNAIVTEVHAGDRLKVGWTSNNHAGGYVRLSLVKFGEHWGDKNAVENNFKRNVLKFACYGHDSRKGGNNGDCNHPCEGRGGCQFQSDIYDKERYDTTIGIPTNLPQGLYVLQTALLVGNSQQPYYSCAKLRIVNGNPSLSCQSSQEPVTYSCVKTGGPALHQNFLRVGATPGDFCYHFDGRIGTTDDDIGEVPVNVQCDPRITCDNAIHKSLCFKEAPDMKNLQRDNGFQKLPGCFVYNTIPPATPSCSDGIKNRDEQRIDCGGQFCKECPPIVKPGEYHGKISQTVNIWGSGGNFAVDVEVTKDVKESQCWQLILQYGHPVTIGSVWGDGRLVNTNDQKTILRFEKPSKDMANPQKGKTLKVQFAATNDLFSLTGDAKVIWDKLNMELQGATTFYVTDDLSECSES